MYSENNMRILNFDSKNLDDVGINWWDFIMIVNTFHNINTTLILTELRYRYKLTTPSAVDHESSVVIKAFKSTSCGQFKRQEGRQHATYEMCFNNGFKWRGVQGSREWPWSGRGSIRVGVNSRQMVNTWPSTPEQRDEALQSHRSLQNYKSYNRAYGYKLYCNVMTMVIVV